MAYKEFADCHDTVKLRENLTVEIPENAIGLEYKPENIEFGTINSDKKIKNIKFVFSNEEVTE